jgi:hypothetical protein
LPIDGFEGAVFINCPFDEKYAPLLEAALFCIICFGLTPRLANERLEAGENRLDKITGMIRTSKYSIHDLSRCRADDAGEYFRMNMPFEYGVDVGFRRGGNPDLNNKKFLIFEKNPYELKRALSDIAGQDVVHHNDDYARVIRHVRDFFRVEGGVAAPGPAGLIRDYATFQEWMVNKKLHEGHSEEEALTLPTRERMDEMRTWVTLGKPTDVDPM